MKSTLRAIIVILSLGLSALAADSPYRFEYTVTNPDGSKVQGSALFLAGDSVRIPIALNSFNEMCVLEFAASFSDKNKENHWGAFTICQNQNANDAAGKSIFMTRLPVTSGKEIELFKVFDQTVSVKITSTEEQKK